MMVMVVMVIVKITVYYMEDIYDYGTFIIGNQVKLLRSVLEIHIIASIINHKLNGIEWCLL